jgi:D-Tyr-tRNAtyr deacylase
MNRSIHDVRGEILVVSPRFRQHAEGNRPYSRAAWPETIPFMNLFRN